MKTDLHIKISDEKIIVSSKQGDINREYKNLLGVISNDKIVSIGQSLEDLIKENPSYETRYREEVEFESIYRSQKPELDNLHPFINFEIQQLRTKKKITLRLFSYWIKDENLNISLSLPNYEEVDKDIRKQFEYSLFQMGVSNIWINNQINDWSRLQRFVLKLSRVILPFASILLWYGFVLFIDQYKNLINWALVLFIWVMSLVVFYYLSILIRILILRNFLPHDLLRLESLEQDKPIGRNLIRLVMSLLDEDWNQ